MICPKCRTSSEKKTFDSFSYNYCNTCKQEVQSTTSKLFTEVKNALLDNKFGHVLMVTADVELLDFFKEEIPLQVDLDLLPKKLILVVPSGVSNCSGFPFHKVFIKVGDITEAEVRQAVGNVEIEWF